MRLFEDFKIKFEQPNWARDLELGLIDTILEQHPHLIGLLSVDITKGEKENVFGRKDTPSVEQIVRAAIYKELKGLEYRELAYHQIDSRICAQFIKIDELRPFSFQMYQKYISQIRSENLQQVLFELNKIAISEGLEDLEKIRQDSTVVETNIHYPTNNSLLWDCIKEAYRLLGHLKAEVDGLSYTDYWKEAKRTYFKISITKGDKRRDLFYSQLGTFIKTINQVSNVVKKKHEYDIKAMILCMELERHLELMVKVHDMVYLKEIKGEKVPNEAKIYSIYEQHTDIIVKGSREVEFGHKIDLCSGKSNLILHCRVLKGNPSDKDLLVPAIDTMIEKYNKVPRDYATDGGYASLANQKYARDRGLINIMFNKIVGSMKNITSSKNMETRLKKWRSGAEAVISNIKRGFNLVRCTWKGWEHFAAKVLWSAIAYNIRVMTGQVVKLV
jgi:IS5 family transposase